MQKQHPCQRISRLSDALKKAFIRNSKTILPEGQEEEEEEKEEEEEEEWKEKEKKEEKKNEEKEEKKRIE